MKALQLLAGAAARAQIARDGLTPDAVRVLAGAAGGPKWLALQHIDRFLFGQWFGDRTQPLFTLGSSIGSWRFTAAAQAEPVAAFARFEAAYLNQEYSARPDANEISRAADQLLDGILGQDGVDAVLQHPYLRPTIITARCLGHSGSESVRSLKRGLTSLAINNARGRHRLANQLQRVLFTHPAATAPFFPASDAFTTHRVALRADNLRAALRASAAVPLLMQAEVDPPGAPAGTYRDGGLIDYHLDVDWGLDQGLVLFPHFSTRIVPGWLDKFLPWRKPKPSHLERVLLLAPTQEFLATLPNGKIPDRGDFQRYRGDWQALYRDWGKATAACEALAAEFADWLSRGTPTDALEAFGG